MNTILDKLVEQNSSVTGINDARNIAEAVAMIKGVGGRGANAIEGQIENYTVSFNANGGSGSIDSVKGNYIKHVELPDGTDLTAPSNKGFAGWAKTSSATDPNVESPYVPVADVTLYAVWKDLYTITYNANGGSGTVSPSTVLAGQTLTLKSGAGLTPPSNKKFKGWGVSSSSTSVIVTLLPASSTTVYAIWVDAT